jgi:hypothetical protein
VLGDEGVSQVDFSSDGGMSWREIERGKEEGNIQFPTMANARLDYKAPIEPKDVDASEARNRRELVELLSLRSNNRRRTVGEQHKLKDGALGFVRGNPQPAIMGLNDRTEDRQTQPHTARFCSEQWIEYPFNTLNIRSTQKYFFALSMPARPPRRPAAPVDKQAERKAAADREEKARIRGKVEGYGEAMKDIASIFRNLAPTMAKLKPLVEAIETNGKLIEGWTERTKESKPNL